PVPVSDGLIITRTSDGYLPQSLDGGEYCNPSEPVAQCLKSAPTTNRAVESAFAYMDYLYRKAPHMRFFRREAITLFVLNHVGEWLDGKSTGERTLILQKALERTKEIVYVEQEKANLLGEEIVKKMEERKIVNDGKALKFKARKGRIAKELGAVGLLSTERAIDRAIYGLRQSHAIDLIKGQLRYRKQVKEQPADPRYYRFSVGGKGHSLETLVSHLKELVRCDSDSGACEEEEFCAYYLGRICQLTTDIELSDGTVLSGPQTVLDLSLDVQGESIVHLQGSSGLVYLGLRIFEDFVEDEVICPI
ncbi:hypothetical protein PMAYCL1PPCAC_29950, partial [Pristionchus mayeri]